MPEAAKLQGDARTQVSQLIANFNELITTQADWRASYGKVDTSLTALLGPDASDPNAAVGTAGTASTAGTAGTSGTTPAASASGAANLDPAIKAKLTQFRSQLKQFEQAAGGSTPDAAASGAMAPTPATGATTSPANPTSSPTNPDPAQPNPTSPSQPPTSSGAVGTSGVTPSSPTASMTPEDRTKAAGEVSNAEVQSHLDAIDEILNASKTGTLTKAQTTELKKHVDQLRAILKKN